MVRKNVVFTMLFYNKTTFSKPKISKKIDRGQYVFFQVPLFPILMAVSISLEEDHELVKLSNILDWDALILLAMKSRDKKIKQNAGPKTHSRALIGVIVLMAMRKIAFRQAEGLAAHYAPARYLCGLMGSYWKIDHVTIFDFTKMLGSEGMEEINKSILFTAQEHGLIDSTEMMSDTTAQEAMIPYPNEVGYSSDKKICLEAVDLHKEKFGVIPETYGFDRGGYSQSNIEKLKKKGVKHVGVAPKGLASWEVSKTKQEQITRERAQVEGRIGSIKRDKYGFNKPDAKSIGSMVAYPSTSCRRQTRSRNFGFQYEQISENDIKSKKEIRTEREVEEKINKKPKGKVKGPQPLQYSANSISELALYSAINVFRTKLAKTISASSQKN